MKRFIPAFLLLLVLLIGYWAWPFFGLRALAGAVQAGDVTAINEKIILPSPFFCRADYRRLSAHYRSGCAWPVSNGGRRFYSRPLGVPNHQSGKSRSAFTGWYR